MPYLLYVDDNFHYTDESARYLSGTFDTAEAALKKARHIVDDFLESAHEPSMSAAQLYHSYVGFGEDPFIICEGDVPQVKFSAWDYARERCDVICGAAKKPKT
jgi:hypothetical protein